MLQSADSGIADTFHVEQGGVNDTELSGPLEQSFAQTSEGLHPLTATLLSPVQRARALARGSRCDWGALRQCAVGLIAL